MYMKLTVNVRSINKNTVQDPLILNHTPVNDSDTAAKKKTTTKRSASQIILPLLQKGNPSFWHSVVETLPGL